MKKTILTIAIIAIIMAAPLWAQSESDFEVRQNPDNTITIIGYNGSVRDVVIPQTLYGLRVTGIGNEAFYRKGLTSVVIPNTVITIESVPINRYSSGAFAGNPNLTRVTLENSIRTIGSYAFAGTGLTEIVIPNSVTSIGARAFENSSIRRVTFGSGLRTIGDGAFYRNQITELNLPASIQTIDRVAFGGNQIRSLTIPNTVTSVGEEAFVNNPIETLVITSRGLGISVFSWQNLTNITLPANMNDYLVSSNFGEAFANFYVNQNRVAGTYLKRGPIWTRATAAELRELEEARRQEEARRRAAEEERQAAIRQEEERQAAIRQAQEEARQAAMQVAAAAGLPVNWTTSVSGANEAARAAVTANFSIGQETVQRQRKDVLIFEVNLGTANEYGNVSFPSNEWRNGSFTLNDDTFIQRFKTANGIRFKVLAVGRLEWTIYFRTTTNGENHFYGPSTFRPRNNNVVDISFSNIRSWNSTNPPFNRDNITSFVIRLDTRDRAGGFGDFAAGLFGVNNANSYGGRSTLKIFDFEIY